MERTSERGRKGLTLAAVLVAVVGVAALTGTLMGCAPNVVSAKDRAAAVAEAADENALENQLVDWTMDSDCSICHTTEAASATNTACVQAVAHEAEDIECIQCHDQQTVLADAHAQVTYGSEAASKATVQSVSEATCISCHGDLAAMAEVTKDSTVLTDDKGTTVNPHQRPAGPKHDANPVTCTDCHNNHSQELSKEAMKYCAQCHHRGTFECGTCHELRDRKA